MQAEKAMLLTRCARATADVTAGASAQHVPDFEMIYKPDFRQEIAASWPRVIDDSCAQEDWNWRPDYDLDAMTDDIVAQLVPRIKLVKQAQEAAEASQRQGKRPPPPPSKSGM